MTHGVGAVGQACATGGIDDPAYLRGMIVAMKPRALLCLLLSLSLLSSPVATQADALQLPDLGDASQAALSPQAEQKLGRQIMGMIRESGEMLDDAEVELYINQLGRRLASASPELGPNFEFFPLLDPQINAFALPGGFIGVHTGLIYTAQGESELASVLAHEMAHVTQRHIARSIAQQGNNQLLAIAGILVAILAASVSKNTQVSAAAMNAGTGMAIQNQLTFSRDFEREADNIGMQILSRAGFDARAMPTFFERMQRVNRANDNQALAFLRTHPVTGERISAGQDRAAQLPVKLVADSPAFLLVREKCRVWQLGPMEAVKFYQHALDNRQFNHEGAIWYGLAVARLKLGDTTNAQTALNEANQRMASHPMLLSLGGDIRLRLRDYAGARALFHEATRRYPDARYLAYGEVDAALAQGDQTGVAALLKPLSVRYANDPALWQRMARQYADHDRLRYHQALGNAYYLQNKPSAALEQYQLASQAPGEDFYLRSAVEARIRELQAQLDEARKENGGKPLPRERWQSGAQQSGPLAAHRH